MKHQTIGYLLAAALLSGGCTGFLDEEASSVMVEGSFYKTEADAEAAIVSTYDGLNDTWNIYWRGLYLLAELPSDNAEAGQGVSNANIFALDDFTFGSVNDRINAFYVSTYGAIKEANVALDRIPTIAFDEGRKNRMLAEARFVRALMYHNLVRLFGEVPLVVQPVKSLAEVDAGKATVQDIYDQIIADAVFAETHLNETNEAAHRGRATKASAKALLADVYLTQKEYAKAAEKAKEIIDSPNHALFADYFDLFKPENRFNSEFLFAVQYKGLTGTSNGFEFALYLPRTTIPLPGGGTVSGNSADVPTQEFYDSYKAGDLRRDRTFFTAYDAGAGQATFRPHWYKYFDPSAIRNLGQGTLNYAVFRYAEMLLVYAEAANEINNGPTAEAYEALNKVRRRAYGKPIATPDAGVDLSGLSKQDFAEAVLDERRWEFGFENKRWFDLVRTGTMVTTLQAKNKNPAEHHALLPIPQRELDVNPNLTQNNGYE